MKIKLIKTFNNYQPDDLRDYFKGWDLRKVVLKIPAPWQWTKPIEQQFLISLAHSREAEIRYVYEIKYPELWVKVKNV